ncbi:bcl-2-like protein 12 isoform X4 [Myotis daubentonii]|uniref:bcl-2-like protein 12 isoform X4 n=1 Tax=Myotis daubentonii TaxID=98922 RepID=UPI00287380F7|nr:bcl-2-like protein 12 isoform X4 [Myotis daubentonii]
MAGSEELGLREDTLRVLAAFLNRGEAAGSPIPAPPRPSDSRLLCPRGPAAGTAGPRATEIPTEPRVTGSPTHREGSPAAEAGGPPGGGGRSHQPEDIRMVNEHMNRRSAAVGRAIQMTAGTRHRCVPTSLVKTKDDPIRCWPAPGAAGTLHASLMGMQNDPGKLPGGGAVWSVP